MKNKKLIIGIVVIIFLVLVIPVPAGVYLDGGTSVYQAFTYKIVKWNRLTDAGTYSNTRVYLFPKSMLPIDELWEFEKDTFVMCGEEPVTEPYLEEQDYQPAEAVNLMSGITPREMPSKTLDNEFVASQMKFSVDLLKKTVSGEKNVLVSPLSIVTALAMTANGADGETLSEMESVIGDNIGIGKLNEYLSAYLRGLPSDDKYKVNIANSIWIRDDKRLSVEQDFLQTNADYYRAGVYKAAFDKQTVKDINNWVEANTDGMIKNILDDIPDDAVMYLINALAFEAEWSSKYITSDVADGTFRAADGSRQKVSMMNSMEYSYLEDDMVTGFVKNYRGGYKFVALLPKEGVSVEEYVTSLDMEVLMGLINNPDTTAVEVAIPKFSYEYDIELSEVLKGLGMEAAFDSGRADFSKMATSSRGNICIGRVLHKTFIELNETGTKAGAATVVEMIEETALIVPDDVKKVVLDRPFVYMIVEGETGIPIFMGTVMSVE